MDLENAYDKIYRYAYFRLKNQELAEDITQETFLRFISSYGNLQAYDMRYLYAIAKNLCIDEYRRVKPDPLPEEDEARAASDAAWADNADTAWQGNAGHAKPLAAPDSTEDTAIVRVALSKLPVEDQELLLLRHVNGESVGTIGKALGLSRFAVYRRLKDAEEALRKGLEVSGS